MMPISWLIRLEAPSDNEAIEALQAEAFGPGRFARTAFRIREGVPHHAGLSFVGLIGDEIAGSCRLTPIRIGKSSALLLGPLAVSPTYKNRGLGRALVRTALEAAGKLGETHVLLVGDEPYYGPLGFERVPFGRISLPGPVDLNRLLVARLVGGDIPQGLVRGA
ncbi:N-acetyltransferase [Stappia sp. F7233]|uniref:N-acetyltransferase n=1 Tax=Stappia albiluteola TaxID=2758565 RepID=A0A839A8R0_9HYPH|nr:N-acetyltransferase [Stappia albiluteola]MBA5775721.1 N-acetyltransferase [Stappia albiluteola]